jgi:hypothetical protein
LRIIDIMETWEKYKFTKLERSAWFIWVAYRLQCQRRHSFKRYLPEETDPRESKYWKYFEEVATVFAKDTMFDPHIFMEAQFRGLPKGHLIYPAQLKTKAATERYQEHKEAIKAKANSTGSSEAIMLNLAATYKFFKKWWKQHGFPRESYAEFFTRKENEMLSDGMLFCLQNMISKYFMATSIHFNNEYEKLDADIKLTIIDPIELKGYRVALILDSEAYLFARQTFKNEIL